jgi:hypothetical protein
MKKAGILLVLAGFILVLASCDKSDESEFRNKLTLGTGMNAASFELTGEGTTFNSIGGSSIIYFRLESKDDMEGADVLLDFLTPDSEQPINNLSRDQAQDYGHIFMGFLPVIP